MRKVKGLPFLDPLSKPKKSSVSIFTNEESFTYGRDIKKNKTGEESYPIKISSASQKGPLLIIAGEHSGDLLGAELLRSLAHLGFSEFVGTGGASMEAQKLETIESIENMTVAGLVEALGLYSRLKKLAKNLCKLARVRKIKTAVLIDYPGFNLRFAAMLKKIGIRVIYLVSPQIWAWNYLRIRRIKKNVDLMLPLFAFEEKIYKKEGVPCHWVGHPLFYHIPRRLAKEQSLAGDRDRGFFLRRAGKLNIGILPGSRSNEIKRLLGPMLEAAQLLYEKYPHSCFFLGGVNEKMEDWIKTKLANYARLPIVYYCKRSLRIMEACDVLILASGTASLEAAYFKKPMLILYYSHWIDALLASFFLRVPHLGIVNILLQRQIVPELLQTEITPKNIFQALEQLVEDKNYRRRIIKDLSLMREQLGCGNPARKAARCIADFVSKQKGLTPTHLS